MSDKSKIVISKVNDKYILCLINGNRLGNIYAYDDLNDEYVPGTIVNGRIEKNIESISSCFVRYGNKLTGFLNAQYKNETVVPVQYKKDPVGDKKALFTDSLSIEGKYVIIFDSEPFVKVSSKINHGGHRRYKEKYEELALRLHVGILIRSAAANVAVSDDMIEDEINNIVKVIDYIRSYSNTRPSCYVLYKPLPRIVKDCEDLLGGDVEEIVTDIQEVCDVLNSDYEGYFGRVKVTDRVGLRFYEDTMLPLSKLYAFESKIAESLSRIIHLKNGANITFDKTEALMAIDVNSASVKLRGDDIESSILNINLAAADEIVRHIILRNISGIIIIDFINMKSKQSYDSLAQRINTLLERDVVKAEFMGFTKLGLAEISRQKMRGSFYEQMR